MIATWEQPWGESVPFLEFPGVVLSRGYGDGSEVTAQGLASVG